MRKLRPVAYEFCGILVPKAPPNPHADCHKATRRTLKALPLPPTTLAVLTPADIQRRWIRAKCDRCRACPDMVG
jgi:hypothetical protein